MIGPTKAELTKLAEKYRTKADAAYYNYQETGIARYDKERRNAEDMAEALQAAADAAEEHNALQSLKAEYNWAAHRADAALASDNVEGMKEVLQSVIAYASAVLNYKRRDDNG